MPFFLSPRVGSVVVGLALAACLGGCASLAAADELAQRASWRPPTAAETKVELDKWLAGKTLDTLARQKIDVLWPADAEVSGEALLERLAATLAIVHPEAGELARHCRQDPPGVVPPKFAFLADATADPFAVNNLRLYYGRWLAQHDYYDEALALIENMAPEQVVDPASLLFYQSVGRHRLVDKEKCLPTLARLLENPQALPKRYETVARLLEADLKPLKIDSLDEVARLMSDVERRLKLAHAGQRVRKEEDDIVKKLDKLIEEMEKQKQQGGGGGSGNGNGGSNPSAPMQDSGIAGNKGPGDVDKKPTDNTKQWGNLPPQERQAALQELAKDLPAHYRDVIEEYFRKIARDGVK